MKRMFGRSKKTKEALAKSKLPRPLTQNGVNKPLATPSSSIGRNISKPPQDPSSSSASASRAMGGANKKDELKTHIEVCARIRPLQINKGRESFFGSSSSSSPRKNLLPPTKKENLGQAQQPSLDERVAWDISEEGDTAAQASHTDHVKGRTHSYTLDKVYGTGCTTNQLYEQSIHSLVKRAMEGYHSSILAYGQTSTGKTHTMTGTTTAPGLIPLCINDCFRYVRESQESREYLIRISYLEVYKEHIQDLLASTPQPVRLFDGKDGLIIKGLKEEVVSSPEQVFLFLKEGETRRQVGATHMNQHSSRSHVMVRLWIESTDVGQTNGSKQGSARVSSLSLVDLAGSESVRLNGTERREEGKYINKSLMALGQVVLSLSDGKAGHIPYRDSKLTRLLQPSLSGNAQMVLLCCISPQESYMEESHNTFKFASRTKKIKQKAVVNVASEEQTLLQNYRDEIEELKKQLAEAKDQKHELQEKATATPISSGETADGEVKELVEAIKTMERLILKSRPHNISSSTSDLLEEDNSEIDLLSDSEDNEDEDDLLDDLLDDEPPKTPRQSEDEALNSELSRIRGLLGSVLQKRGVATPDTSIVDTDLEKTLDFSTPPRSSPAQQKEVVTLRKQLEDQELTTNLRKADSSFLQSQLKEKDMLLEEISNVLEAVDKRQTELEKDNASLRAELKHMREENAVF